MMRQSRFRVRLKTSLIFCVIFLASVTLAAAGNQAEVTASGSILQVSAGPGITYMQLRVADPAGNMVYTGSNDGSSPLSWVIPPNAVDGLYSYEIRMGTAQRRQARDIEQPQRTVSRPVIESGGFLVEKGVIVPQTGEETSLLRSVLSTGTIALRAVADFLVSPAMADQQILDDLVVNGSECVGQDCVNGENFSFDTLRLKENNLRIHFQDTSTSASFPTTDWRIVINDSANGGASYFAVEDSDAAQIPFKIEANAPQNSLVVKNSGNIGVGTSLPATEVHVVDGDSPTLRLDQDGSQGWTPQVWDVAANEVSFFVRDVTNGSTLPFRIQPGTPSNTLYLTNNGNVGIGTTSPTQKLHVEGSALISGNLELGSSREIKNNIRDLDTSEAMTTVAMLRPVKFEYKNSPREESVGFIAEEVPDLVATNSRKSLSTMDIVAVLTKVVQEQQKAIEELNATIASLQRKLDSSSTGPVSE